MVSSLIIMEKTGDKLIKSSQQSDLYNYNLDHVYCSDTNTRYRPATSTHLNLAAAASDLKSLRKENKQLQAMLLLHLDLIQEQSNQLIAKDKQLLQLREENAQLRIKCERTTTVVNDRRQNNNRYVGHTTSGKLLNTSGGSPTIDTYFQTNDTQTTTTTTKLTQNRTIYHEPLNNKIKFQTAITNQNILLNSNNSISSTSSSSSSYMVSNENQIVINENRPIQTITTIPTTITSISSAAATRLLQTPSTIPIKIEVDPIVDDIKLQYAFSDMGQIKENRLKFVTSTSTINNTTFDKIMPVKYENNIIRHNNGKISKIILQRKKSDNGEKIFVRTKNIEIANNKVNNFEKWSPLRTIKSEVIETNEIEQEPIVLETTIETPSPTSISPKSTPTTTINDEHSLDAMETMDTNYLTTSADISPPPSIKTPIDHSSDLSTDCNIDNIKIEQELEEMHESEHNSPAYELNETHDTLDDSQDMLNIESPLTNESIQMTVATSSSPITSTVSTCDFNQSDLFSRHLDRINSTTTINSTIVYPTKRHNPRNAFLTTKKPYKIREWQLDEIEMEIKQEITDEVCKDENESNLEIPKWRTWELSSNREVPVHSREYEDLSDDAFSRRHARFLLDERKRKKWDVQRIREQRTIERLKRRHCKDELNQQKEFNEITTFFPTVDQLKSIQITDDLPVSAFGESIPLLPPSEFSLPWHLGCHSMTTATTTTTTTTMMPEIIPKVEEPISSDLHSRSNSNCSSTSFEPANTVTANPSNVSSIIFLAKKRAGRTRTSISHTLPNTNSKTIT